MPVEHEIWSNAMTSWHSDQQAITLLEHGGEIRSRTFSGFEEELLTGGTMSRAGIPMSASEALRVSTVFACRRVIAEDVGQMPRLVKRVSTDTRGRRILNADTAHPLHALLTIAPNDWMTAMELFEWWVGTAVLHDAAYIYPTRDQNGRILELLPLLPGSVTVEQDTDWAVQYRVTALGTHWIARPGDLLKLQGPPRDDGLTGFQVSRQAREAVALAAAMESSQSRFHANDLRPAGTLSTAKSLAPEVRDAIRAAWQKAYGPGGTGGIAVLDEDFKFSALTTSGIDGQVIDNRKFQIEEMCRFFRVNPHIVGHNSGSQSYSSVEQVFEAHKTHTLRPWVIRAEQALTRWLLAGEPDCVIDLDMDALSRGTGTDRINYYDKAIKTIMTPNEARAREGWAPLDDPDMDRVQIMRNNTGTLAPGAAPARLGAKPTDDNPDPATEAPAAAVAVSAKDCLPPW